MKIAFMSGCVSRTLRIEVEPSIFGNVTSSIEPARASTVQIVEPIRAAARQLGDNQMRTFLVAAIAGVMSLGIGTLAPGMARADWNDTSTGDFCYGGWTTEIFIDFEQGMVFVHDTCGDIGDTVYSYYRIAK